MSSTTMSAKNTDEKIRMKIAFLERLEREKEHHRSCRERRREREAGGHIVMLDVSNRWTVRKNPRDRGYKFVSTRQKNKHKVDFILDVYARGNNEATSVNTTSQPRHSPDRHGRANGKALGTRTRAGRKSNVGDEAKIGPIEDGRPTHVKKDEAVGLARGMHVISRNKKDGLYYPGEVLECDDKRYGTVTMMGGQQKVLITHILPIDGAVTNPPVYPLEYALVRMKNEDHGYECYVPAIVLANPSRGHCHPHDQFYTVSICNGQKVTILRHYMVKISKERYELTTRYIFTVLGTDGKFQVEDQPGQSKSPKRDTKILRVKVHVSQAGKGPHDRPVQINDAQSQTTGGEQPTEDEDSQMVRPWLLQVRRSLPPLQPEEKVLARFRCDGWYYRGKVQQNLKDMSYLVEDTTRFVERIWREDIIADNVDNAPPLVEDEHVVAKHPHHELGYAPGHTETVDTVRQTVKVRFFDGQRAVVQRVDVYRLPRDKYQHDVSQIHQRRQAMLGLSVVARNDETGEYLPGRVKSVDEDGGSYTVCWSDGKSVTQKPAHVFSSVMRRPSLRPGDGILAVSNPGCVLFLPGQVEGVQGGALTVRFCDGQVRSDVNLFFSYWLSQTYYKSASQYWKTHQPAAHTAPI